ncbi:hypothetical protein KJ836_01770 [Patescibacteria group bacterium]|nr:hypothetical protein [Patescibacteria group bacterium]
MQGEVAIKAALKRHENRPSNALSLEEMRAAKSPSGFTQGPGEPWSNFNQGPIFENWLDTSPHS